MKMLKVFIAALAVGLSCVPAALATAPTLTRAGGAPFPSRQYVLALPNAASIDTSKIQVFENGRRVASPLVLRASAASARALGVVLVIDTSGSMKGRPIQNAMSAARMFAAHRNTQQQLGVITFNGAPSVRLPLTSDPAAIDAALSATPVLGRNTHIYDAVAAAISALQKAHIDGGSVVVLSDGTDTGSALTGAGVAARARAAGVRVYSVGLRSGAFDAGALRDLADAANGSYSEASSAGALGKIYDALGAQLSSQYLIRYRSSAHPSERVKVTVLGPGLAGTIGASYSTPGLPSASTPPFHPSVWQSATTLLGVSLLVAFLLGLAILTVLRARPPKRGLRTRVADFITPRVERDRDSHPRLSERLLASAERNLEGKRWWAAFKEDLEVGRVRMPPTQVALLTALATLVAMGVLYAFSQSVPACLLGLGTPLLVKSAVTQRATKRRKEFADQLAENLQVIASAMRAGQSFSGALAIAVQDAPEPARSEFERVVGDERLGVPLDVALGVVARRMKNRDLEQVQLVAALQRQTGGNMAEVLDQAADTIRERADLRRLIRTLTAQGRMSRWVLSGLPVFLILAISALNPGYLSPLFHTGGGKVVLVFAAGLVVTGSYVIKRIVEIEV
jgi:Flp pilus assembly protein TadB/Mg-chelatase subunit ChlD